MIKIIFPEAAPTTKKLIEKNNRQKTFRNKNNYNEYNDTDVHVQDFF